MNFKPMYNTIIVCKLNWGPRKVGRIELPSHTNEEMEGAETILAEVLAVGPGSQLQNGERQQIDVSPGQHVLLPKKASCFPLKLSPLAYISPNGDGSFMERPVAELLVVNMSSVLCVVELPETREQRKAAV